MCEELVSLARRMSADLQDFADAARESGSPVIKTESLLSEFDGWHNNNGRWQDLVSDNSNANAFHFGDEQ